MTERYPPNQIDNTAVFHSLSKKTNDRYTAQNVTVAITLHSALSLPIDKTKVCLPRSLSPGSSRKFYV